VSCGSDIDTYCPYTELIWLGTVKRGGGQEFENIPCRVRR
jgi:hypothetical protein